MSNSPGSDPFGERQPPAALRSRITNSLLAGGFVEPRAAQIRRATLRGVALVALAGAAFAAGRLERSPEATTGPEFLFLLYEDSSYRDDRPIREIVTEYGAWADSLRRDRSLVIGERLGDERLQLATVTEDVRQHPTGLFIVRASNLESAAEIARTSPHLRYGGRIMVHRVDH